MPSETLLLLGMGPTALDALEALAPRFTVVGLVRPGDRDAVADRARDLGVPVTGEASPAAVATLVARTRPDAVVVSSYDRVLPADLLAACPFVNVHYAPLPRYRGRAPVNWSLLNDEPCTAISVHSLVAGLDAGGILAQEQVPIGPRATVTELYDQLNALQRRLLPGAVERRLAGDEGTPQREADATYGCTRLPADGEIDWARPTAEIDRLVRALAPPYPGAFTFLGLERLWVRAAEPVADPVRWAGRVPGRVVARAAGGVDVLTGDGVLRLRDVQPDGGPAVPARTAIRSVKATLGLRPTDLLDRLAAAERELAVLRAPA